MAIRRAEVIFVGDAASIVRAAKQAEAASAQTAEAAKRAGADTAAANKTAGDSADASATKQVAAHKRTTAAISGTATAMTKLTAPILLAAGAGAKFAMDFQAQMERVHTQANVSQKAVAELSKGVLGMSGAVAQAPQALADGIYHVASSLNATLPAATAVSTELRVMKVAAEGATVGHANLVDVTNALDAAVVSGIKGIQNYTQGMGALNAIVGAGDMKMQDLADALGTGILGPMKTFGLSLKDVGGALAVFGDNNIRGQDAATKLTSAVRIMAAPSKAAAKELATIGLSTLQLANDMRSGGIVKALADLKQHLQDSGDTASQQGLIISRAFGGRQSTGVQLLLGQLDRLKAKTGEVSAGAQGFAAAWTATQGTAAFKMQSALATMKADLTSFGTAVLPPLLAAGAAITGAVDHVAKAFSSLPGGAQKAIITGGLILAGIGPAMKILGVFSSSIAKMWQIAQLISGTKVIGGPAGGGAASAGSAAAGAEGAATSGVGAVRSIASRALGGAAIGGLGVLLSQTIGSSIHGAVGKAVKTIGTDTSIGAGVGAIFGPLGMAGGALIGGLVGSVTTFITDHAGDQGKKFAAKFTADLPNAVNKATTAGLATATTSVQTAKDKLQADRNKKATAAGHGPTGAGRGAGLGGAPTGTDAADLAVIKKKYFDQGWTAGNATVQGLKAAKDPTAPIILSDFLTKLKAMPAQAQPAAAKVMASFAIGLEQSGKIPYAGLQNIIKGLQSQIPGFAAYIQNQGQVINQVFSKTLMLSPATKTLTNTLAGYRKQFDDMVISTNITGQNIDQNMGTAMSHLQTIISSTSGKTRQDAVAEFNKLHDQSVGLFDSMANKVQTSIKNMGDAIKSGSASAAKVASANLSDFAANVGQAMQNGVVSVGQGMKLIIDNTNKALKEMGQKQLSPIQVSSLTLGTAKQRQLAGHAGGGLVQFGKAGDRGRDTIPVNFGGAHIAVGSGEVGMVANNQQQAFLNARTADVGGLPGVFSKFSKKHYMASGGIVTASEYGGPSDHTVSQTDPRGYKGDNLLQHPDSYAELNMGTALGGLPYMAPLNVTYHGKTARLFKRDIGAGGPGLNGHTRAIDLWFQAANSLGFNGLGNVTVGGAGGANVKIGGGAGGALGNISAPGIKGSGAMATIANAAMKILTKGANAYIGSKTPASTGGGGSFSFQNFSGKLPAAAQKAMQVAQYIVGRHVPYGTGEFGAYYGMGGNAPSYDCSGFVSTVLNLAGLDPAGHLLTGGLKQWGEPGPGKYITVGVLGADSGPTGHTMMEIANKYFESGGGGGGPHQDSGWSSVFPIMRHPAGLAKGGIVRGGKDKIFPGHAGHQPTLAEFLSDRHSGLTMAGGGVLPFVGSYKSGGVIPQTGMALVHKNETVLPAFASGGIPNAAGMTAPFLYPLDAAIAALAAKIAALQSAALPNHNKDIAALTAELVKIRRERINPPAAHNAGQITTLQSQLTGMRKDGRNLPTPASGKAGDTQRAANAQKRKDLSQQELDIETKIAALKKADTASVAQRRKDLENQTLTIEQKIKTLKGDDKATVNQNAALVVGITLQSKNLQQLNNYKQAIAALSTQMVGMAEQAAQAWNAAQQKQITATHDAAIAAIQGGADATTLAAMQAQDTADANAAQLAALQATLATDQTTVNNSGGQTHVDALAQVKADQAAIDAFQRQQTEDQLQANIDAATTKADDAQQAALDGLDQQTADYQASLDAQLAALTASLDQRKLNYAQWAADVDAILQPYGLSASTDPTTEGTVSTGPGPGGGPVTVTTKTAKTVVPPKPKKGKSSGAFTFGGARAMGGEVQPGYVYRVGEQGPEDVVFGQSGTVHTAAQTRAGSGGWHGPLIGVAHFNGARAASAMADRLAYKAAIGTA